MAARIRNERRTPAKTPCRPICGRAESRNLTSSPYTCTSGSHRRADGHHREFHVGALWIGREVETPILSQLEALARARGILIQHEARGQSFDLDGAKGEILWPETDSGDITASAKNNDSLVMRLQSTAAAFFCLATPRRSGVGNTSENTDRPLAADVLKVGHHGSKNSTRPEFLVAVHRNSRLFPPERRIPTAIRAKNSSIACATQT